MSFQSCGIFFKWCCRVKRHARKFHCHSPSCATHSIVERLTSQSNEVSHFAYWVVFHVIRFIFYVFPYFWIYSRVWFLLVHYFYRSDFFFNIWIFFFFFFFFFTFRVIEYSCNYSHCLLRDFSFLLFFLSVSVKSNVQRISKRCHEFASGNFRKYKTKQEEMTKFRNTVAGDIARFRVVSKKSEKSGKENFSKSQD